MDQLREPERVTHIRLRCNEGDAKDLEGILTEVRSALFDAKRAARQSGESVAPINRTIKRLDHMITQLREEMVLVGWMPPESVPDAK